MLEIRETSAYADWFASLRDRVSKLASTFGSDSCH